MRHITYGYNEDTGCYDIPVDGENDAGNAPSLKDLTDVTQNSSDTREKLEADIEDYFSLWMTDCKRTKKAIHKWLDRQAAITERECGITRGLLEKQTEKITELQAKLDDRVRSAEYAEEVMADLQAQLDEMIKARNRAGSDAKTQRNYFEVATEARKTWQDKARAIERECDELRAELAAREQLETDSAYMRLPVDADGMPIRLGDELAYTDGEGYTEHFVCGGYESEKSYGMGELMPTNDDDNSISYYAHGCRHVQPKPTIEDVLADYQQDVLTTEGEYAGEVIDADEYGHELDRLTSEYADKVREVMGDD